MFEQRSSIAALVVACMVTAFAAGSFAQQAAPPAVLVQAAEQTPVADQFGIHRPGRRGRQGRAARPGQGLPGAAQVHRRRHGEARTRSSSPSSPRPTRPRSTRRPPSATPRRLRSPTPICSSSAPPSCCAPTPAPSRPTTSGSPSSCRPRRTSRTPGPSCAMPRSSSPTPPSSRRSRAASAAPRSRPATCVSPDSGVLATVVSETPIRVLFPVTQRELLEAKRDATAGDPPSCG